ncbi:MAG: hypothetical protein CMG74_09110 [Candidatus Marinimicrobia bacterium]|nr:hypothetical protein [Candidatus Neomarinimicrobiota bacterium]|tara:strand:- start:2677 stop:2901 length:225 start_codon:yes stop_codon:yes gene_type:complete
MDIILISAIWYSLSLGISIFIMVIIDLEHPLAAGTAFGMTMIGYNSESVYAFFISIFLLAMISHYGKPFLKDLV